MVLRKPAQNICYVCENSFKRKEGSLVYGKKLCGNKMCNLRLKNEAVKRLGITEFVKNLEIGREKNKKTNNNNLIKRFKEINKDKLKERNLRKFKSIDFVFKVELSRIEVSLLIGLNYAYKINKEGKVFKVYNFNEEEESLEGIKRKLSSEDIYILEPFLILLDERKSIKKWNSI